VSREDLPDIIVRADGLIKNYQRKEEYKVKK
jgi:hypothetical protein